MPAISLQTSVKCSDKQKERLAKGLSEICATQLNKPELYVMSMVHDNITIFFAGSNKDAAMVDVKSIGGLSNEINNNFSKAVCVFLAEHLNVEPNNTYINFTDVARENWGWNSSTFA